MASDTPDPAAPERSNKDPLRQWHRAFGIALIDVFAGAPWTVELELELALRSQLLDVAIIEATGPSRHGHWELLEHLHRLYRREVPNMAYTMEQFLRETHERVIDEAIRSNPEAILKRFDPDDRLRGLDPEDVLGRYDPEDRLQGLDPKFIEAWLAKQRG